MKATLKREPQKVITGLSVVTFKEKRREGDEKMETMHGNCKENTTLAISPWHSAETMGIRLPAPGEAACSLILRTHVLEREN